MADGIIDSLSIEIEASSESAEQKLRKIASALRAVKKASDASFGKGLTDMLNTINRTDDSGVTRLIRLMNELKAVGKVSIGNTLARQVRDLADAVNELNDDTIRRIDALTRSLERLRGINIGGVARAARGASSSASGGALSQVTQQAGPLTGGLVAMGGVSDSEITRIFDSFQTGVIGAQSQSKRLGVILQNLYGKTKKTVLGAKGLFDKWGESISSNGVIGALNSLMKSMGRIATYRAIRTAIKFVTEAIKEGTENAYYFSKAFEQHEAGSIKIATAYDNLASASFKMSNQLGAAWSSLVRAIAPLIMQIISYITALANTLTQIFAMFAGRSTYLKAIDYNKQWGTSASGAAKAAKEWKNQLMGFDEINRLEAPADTTGGGGGASTPDYSKMYEMTEIEERFKGLQDKFETVKALIKAHMDDIEKILIGAELGLGLILLLTGANIPIGLALTVDGAKRLVSGIKEDWGWAEMTLGEKFTAIEAIVIGAATAIGAILLLSGANIPLGLGLLAFGVARFAVSSALNWDDMPSKMQDVFGKIAMIIGGAFLALGLILTLAAPGFSPLGIGLIAIGAATLAGGVAVDWKATSGNIKKVLTDILVVAGAAMLAIGLVLALTGANIPLGIGLMIAGAAALGAGLVALNWDSIKSKVSEGLGGILMYAGGVLAALGVILLLTGNFPLGIALLIAGIGVFGVAAASYDWDALGNKIKDKLSGIHENVKNKIHEIGESISSKWESIKESTSQKWESIKTTVGGKVETLKTNIHTKFELIKEKVGTLTENTKTNLTSKWESIKTTVTGKIKSLKEGIVTKFQSIKDSISRKLEQIKSLFHFEWSFPHIKLPHFSWSWTDLGMVSIPNISVSWYAKGGVFDKASLIGVGEAGKEAVVPLERNMEWTQNVASQIQKSGGMDNGDTATAIEESGDEIVSAIMSAAVQIIAAMREGNGSGGNMDFDRFVQQVTKTQRRQARAAGMT